MKHSFKNALIKIWPIIVILGITFLLFLRNYSPNTWLIGWDNLTPEFNLGMNIQHSIFAVWQEYQGLGLLGGMGHASDLIHQLSLLIMSVIVPTPLLRYTWTFLMLFIGSAGAYFLIKKLILKDSEFSYFKKQSIALLGALFYLLNLSTIQSFYAPFEAFMAHFAALPWLLLSSLLFFIKPNLRNGLFFIIVLILATPQAYIPTLFLVYIISLLILTFSLGILKPSFFSLKSFLKMMIIIIVVNAFWLFPFLYFTLTNSQVALAAKINQMSTETVFLQNKAYGDIFDVMLLKGFWFSNVDPNLKAVFSYMLNPWRNYLSNIPIIFLGYFLFGVVLAGIATAIKKGKNILIAFFVLFLFAFTMLTTDIPPFSWANILFRQIPLFNEVFRFPFTKFSILTSLMYAIFLCLGVVKLTTLPVIKRVHFKLVITVFALLLLIFTLPAFNGKLFYEKEKLNLPKEYLQVFDFFKNQDSNTRIADLPQPTFWGWEFYNWGYGGSGFLWYGIKQPILDRAFDVWSRPDENYYWELSQAIYSKNPAAFTNVLNKYQITWLLMDNNLIYPSSPTALATQNINSLIKQNPSIQKAAQFGNIEIYKVSLKDNPKNFIFSSNLQSANPYTWGDNDKAYADLGNYASPENQSNFYPFRSLFSNKNQTDLEYKIVNENNDILLTNPLPEYKSSVNLHLDSYLKDETIIAADVIAEKNSGNVDLKVILKTPVISIINNGNRTTIYSKTLTLPLISIPLSYKDSVEVNINGVKTYQFSANSSGKLGTTFLLTNQDNLLVFNGQSFTSKIITIKATDLSPLLNQLSISLPSIGKNSILEVKIPKINDNYESFEQKMNANLAGTVKNCDNFNHKEYSAKLTQANNQNVLRLESSFATACLQFSADNLIHDEGYAFFAENANQSGRTLHFWLLNDNENYSPIDTYLTGNAKLKTDSFILAPQEEFGKAYSLHFDNISITNDHTVNYLGNISAYPIPYNFLTAMTFSVNLTNGVFEKLNYQSIFHPNESEYLIKNVNNSQKTSIILSQSYDAGWKAYAVSKFNILNEAFPFLFGKEIKQHILVNNWENGWIISGNEQGSSIIIVYLPQYLEYLGFAILILPVLVVVLRFLALKRARKKPLRVDF